jgi:hypothetical protein
MTAVLLEQQQFPSNPKRLAANNICTLKPKIYLYQALMAAAVTGWQVHMLPPR